MATIVESLLAAAAAVNNVAARLLGLETRMEAKFATVVTDTQNVVAAALPTLKVWFVDPIGGSDDNDGSTLAKSKKTLHSVFTLAAPSTKHLVYVMNDMVHEYYSGCFADISLRGSMPTPASDGYAYVSTRRRLTFRPEALNSPLAPGYRATSGFGYSSMLNLYNFDVYLADVPDGMNISEHFRANAGSLAIDLGAIFATTAGNAGRLVSSVGAVPTAFYFFGAIASAALGRIFSGIAAGGDPRVGSHYTTNLTTN